MNIDITFNIVGIWENIIMSSNIQVRQCVYQEVKHHSDGISLNDLMLVTNSTKKEVEGALKYFHTNGIITKVQYKQNKFKWKMSD